MDYKYDVRSFTAKGIQPMLNLGCGHRYDTSWVNVDFLPIGEVVLQHNLTTGIPFADASFNAVYHSHVLEHFSADEGRFFIAECFRVLKPGGIIRIAVPDLEVIARSYLTYLDAAAGGDPSAYEKYEWMKLEMYDQVARHVSGGEYKNFLDHASETTKTFARERLGKEIDSITEDRSAQPGHRPRRTMGNYIRFARRAMVKIMGFMFADPTLNTAYQTGAFRMSGEIHQCMYDRVSLGRLLASTGFADAHVVSAFESMIPDFVRYELDASNCNIRKPDSLFMEARKA